jgi:cell division protein FtsQ
MSRVNPNAKPKTRKKGRKTQAGLLQRIGWRRLAKGGAVLGFLGGCALIWTSGLPQSLWVDLQKKLVAESAEAGLVLDELLVVGRKRTSQEELIAALDVRQGQPILTYDLESFRVKLEALPWVKSAVVGRQLPGSLTIQLVEREPLAVWQNRGQLVVIDQHGEEIPLSDIRPFAALPLVVGPDAPQHAVELVTLLAREPELSEKVVAGVRIGGRRWNLRLIGDIDVQLPESAPEEAYSQLARLAREHDLLERDLRVIDLRLPDRMILHGVPEGGGDEGEQAKGQAT